jgi:hypothetical protein
LEILATSIILAAYLLVFQMWETTLHPPDSQPMIRHKFRSSRQHSLTRHQEASVVLLFQEIIILAFTNNTISRPAVTRDNLPAATLLLQTLLRSTCLTKVLTEDTPFHLEDMPPLLDLLEGMPPLWDPLAELDMHHHPVLPEDILHLQVRLEGTEHREIMHMPKVGLRLSSHMVSNNRRANLNKRSNLTSNILSVTGGRKHFLLE